MIKKLLKFYGMIWLTILSLIAVVIVLIGLAWAYESFLYSQRPDLTQSSSTVPDDINSEFRMKVEQAFPIGADEQLVIKQLSNLGFTINGVENYAHLKLGRFPCVHQWTVVWKAEQSQIAALQGRFDAVCP